MMCITLTSLKQSEVKPRKIDTIATSVLTYENHRFLDFQKAILKFPVREDNNTWIQGASVNQNANEIYIARQSNGGTVLTIEIRDLTTGLIKDSNHVSIKSNSYAEGLPWFLNSEGELCFLVRQVPADSISIYNYTRNKVERSFNLSGQYKIGFDYYKQFIITSNSNLDTFYIYNFDSVVGGTPKLVHTVQTDREKLFFEKPQGITMDKNKIILSHGSKNGSPAISVINMQGQLENIYYFERKSYAKMINKSYPSLIINEEDYEYENEGIFMFKNKGKISPALVQIINAQTTIIVLSSDLEGERVIRKYPF